MTCIVGAVDAATGIVHIGGDSAGVAGHSLTHRSDPKVFLVGEFAIGFSGSFRMGQLLQHSLVPPMPKSGESLEKFMVTRFIDAVRLCLKEGGNAKIKNDTEEAPGAFLVGFRGRLFAIDTDFQVGEAIDKHDACGAGEDVAKGALCATEGKAAKDRVLIALSAAERCNSAVRKPFLFVETPPYKKPTRRSRKPLTTPPAGSR
jgi:hypothetical protein